MTQNEAAGRDERRVMLDDLRDRLVAWLVSNGFDVSQAEASDARGALEACLRVFHRSIVPQPRNVHWSKELRARTHDAEILTALQTIEAEFRDGEDVNHRLTRQYFDAGFDDRLLNDLGVNHLHLGAIGAGTDKTKARTMSAGTSEILWIIVRQRDAYFIDVLKHSAFSTFDFVKAVGENWKQLLGDPLPGVSELEPKFSPEERARLRRIGISTAIEFDGELFMPGGYVKSGTSMAVVQVSNRILNCLVEMHRWLAENIEVVVAKVEEVTGLRAETLRLRAGDIDKLLAERPTLVDQATGTVFYKKGNEIRYRFTKTPPSDANRPST